MNRQARFPFSRTVLSAILFSMLTSALFPASTLAAPYLRCQIDQGGEIKMLEFKPVSDPYNVAAIDINGRFRFKAVMIGDEKHVEYIKLYTYYPSGQKNILLHEAYYNLPVAQIDPPPAALTGVNYLYSPRLERELQYGCALFEIAP